MRVLAITPLYPPHSLVGAWLTTHDFLVGLTDRGHQVDVVQSLSRIAAYNHDGITVHPRRGDLAEWAAKADVIVSHAGDDCRATALALTAGKPSVRMVHGRVANPAKQLGNCALAVFNSHALRNDTRWDGPAIVAHPPLHVERYRATPGDELALVNLSTAKGSAVFWSLATSMPDRRFLAVRGGYGRQVVRHRPNVSVVSHVEDMRDVYGRTRVLLAPSAAETWGRVGLEAACSGIPTIANPTPGLLESLGDAGVFVDRSNPAGWAAAIERLDDPGEYAVVSAAARRRVEMMDPHVELDRFADEIEGLVA